MVLLAVAWIISSFRAEKQVPLSDIKPLSAVSSGMSWRTMSSPFTIQGVQFKAGVVTSQSDPEKPVANGSAAGVYQIPERAHYFRASFGVSSGPGRSSNPVKVRLLVDGDVLLEEQAVLSDLVKKIAVDITGKKQIRIELIGGAALGAPEFVVEVPDEEVGTDPAPPTTQNPTTQPSTSQPSTTQPSTNPATSASALKTLTITKPEAGQVFKDRVTLEWTAVKGATSYGVEIVLLAKAGRETPDQWLRAYNRKSNKAEWVFNKSVVSGDYQVSVIAFGPNGVISKFSPFRKFKIAR